MIKTAKKHNIRWETTSVDSVLLRQLPAWFHIGATSELNKLNNNLYVCCLMKNHKAITVGQIESIANRQLSSHHKNKNCQCDHCISDHDSLSCAKPFKCKKLACEILQCILPKWNLNTVCHKFNPDLSDKQHTSNEKALKTRDEVLFDPRLPMENCAEDKFRVFVKSGPPSISPASQAPPPRDAQTETLTAVIDSAYHIDQDGEHVSGAGIWINNQDLRNKQLRLPDQLAAPGAREIGALLHIAQTTPKSTPL
ncbi:hypothetical protein BDR05DRAFT_894463, partial [Suillus weaverae]